MREDSEVADQVAHAREWERDRKAWNLPRARREVGVGNTDLPTDEGSPADVQPAAADGTIRMLPRDISDLDRDELRQASDTRDERLAVLFRRWPSLSRIEMKEIRHLHDERQRLARCIGLLGEDSAASA